MYCNYVIIFVIVDLGVYRFVNHCEFLVRTDGDSILIGFWDSFLMDSLSDMYMQRALSIPEHWV